MCLIVGFWGKKIWFLFSRYLTTVPKENSISYLHFGKEKILAANNKFHQSIMSNCNYYRPFEKPLQHLGIDDWSTRTNHLCNLASVHRTNAFDLIQASRSVRDENQVQANFNTTNNTIRLANR